MATEYIATIKINDWVTGDEPYHAADPAKVEPSTSTHGRYLVTTRCGVRYTDPVKERRTNEFELFAKLGSMTRRCGRCEQLIAKENAAEFEAADHSDASAINLLADFAQTLPRDHHDLPGVIRAIEVLKRYGNP
jgi:hypothetical protein